MKKCNSCGGFFVCFLALSPSKFLTLFSFMAAHAIYTWFIDPARVRYMFAFHITVHCLLFFSFTLWQNSIHRRFMLSNWKVRKWFHLYSARRFVHAMDVRCYAFSWKIGCIVVNECVLFTGSNRFVFNAIIWNEYFTFSRKTNRRDDNEISFIYTLWKFITKLSLIFQNHS